MQSKSRRRISILITPVMFGLAIAFLACLATLVVVWVDVPSLTEKAADAVDEVSAEQSLLSDSESQSVEQDPAQTELALIDEIVAEGTILHDTWMTRLVLILICLLWPLFWVEAIYHWVTRPWNAQYRGYHLRSLAFCICPPLRMGARNPDFEGAMWFPGLGWHLRNEHLRMRLQRFFSLPMLGIAVLILPVLGIEFFLSKQVAEHAILRFGLHFSTGLIWFAFTSEFIVMISAAEDRLDYCKKHWLDLAIILLPLISFLRSLQIVRATRLAKLTKVQQLSKMARVYRLRGVSTRALRALLLLEVAKKLIRPKPAKHLVKLRAEHRRLSRELRELEVQIEQLEAKLAEVANANTVARDLAKSG